jgi:hypothetical protein
MTDEHTTGAAPNLLLIALVSHLPRHGHLHIIGTGTKLLAQEGPSLYRRFGQSRFDLEGV